MPLGQHVTAFVGKCGQLSNYDVNHTVSWSISNDKVLSFDGKTYTALHEGITVLSILLMSGETDTYDFTITSAVTETEGRLTKTKKAPVKLTLKKPQTPNDSPLVTIQPTPKDSPLVTIQPTPKDSPLVTIQPTPNDSPLVTIQPTPNGSPLVTIQPTPNGSPLVTIQPTSQVRINRVLQSRDLEPTPLAQGRSWFYPSELATIYDFPTTMHQNPVTICVVSFGGGLFGTFDSNGVMLSGEVKTYWTARGISTESHPKVIVQPMYGLSNNPGTDDGNATLENCLDIELVGALCPSNKVTIILCILPSIEYFALFMKSPTFTIGSQVYRPTIFSISWALGYEITNSQATIQPQSFIGQLETTLTALTVSGYNICAATGDYGAFNPINAPGPSVVYPAASPSIIAVGGTRLICPNNVYDNQTVETAWTDGGGGITLHTQPSYQTDLAPNETKRTIPDVAAVADTTTGVAVLYNGVTYIVGGTSLACPLFASFLVHCNPNRFVLPTLYNAIARPTGDNVTHDIVSGNNGLYYASTGLDYCTGLGTINGGSLFTLLSNINTRPTNIEIIALDNTLTVTASGEKIVTLLHNEATLTVSAATMGNNNNNNNNVLWTISGSEILTLSDTYSESVTITGLTSGRTYLCATVPDTGLSSHVTISVNNIAVSGVTAIDLSMLTLSESRLLTTLNPPYALNKNVYWSTESSLFTIISSSLGTIIAGDTPGIDIATVTTADGQYMDTCEVNVLEDTTITPTGLVIGALSDIVAVGLNAELVAVLTPPDATYSSITWTSSNSRQLTLAPAFGQQVTATMLQNSREPVTVTATILSSRGDLSLSNSILFYSSEPTQHVDAALDTLSLQADTSYVLTAIVTPPVGVFVPGQNYSYGTNPNLLWLSSDTYVATVESTSSGHGIVSAHNTGTTQIYCQTLDGSYLFSFGTLLTVTASGDPILATEIIIYNEAVAVSESAQIDCCLFPVNVTNNQLRWSLDDTSIASIDSTTGVLMANITGVTRVTVETTDGSNVSASTTVYIYDPTRPNIGGANEVTINSITAAPFAYDNLLAVFLGYNGGLNTNALVLSQQSVIGGAAVYPQYYSLNKLTYFGEAFNANQTNMILGSCANPLNPDFIYLSYISPDGQLRVMKLYRNLDSIAQTYNYLIMWSTKLGAFNDVSLTSTTPASLCMAADVLGNIYVELFSIGSDNSDRKSQIYKIKEYSFDLGQTFGTLSCEAMVMPRFLDRIENYYTIAGNNNMQIPGYPSINIPAGAPSGVLIGQVTDATQSGIPYKTLEIKYVNYNVFELYGGLQDDFKSSIIQAFSSLYNVQMSAGDVSLAGSGDKMYLTVNTSSLRGPCVVRGTEIIVYNSQGQAELKYIEHINVGDYVMNQHGRATRVLLHMSEKIYTREENRPYIVTKDFFGKDRPYKNLLISGDHGILLSHKDSTMICASSFKCGSGRCVFKRLPAGMLVEYHHILLENDDKNCFIANGLEVDSYHMTVWGL